MKREINYEVIEELARLVHRMNKAFNAIIYSSIDKTIKGDGIIAKKDIDNIWKLSSHSYDDIQPGYKAYYRKIARAILQVACSHRPDQYIKEIYEINSKNNGLFRGDEILPEVSTLYDERAYQSDGEE